MQTREPDVLDKIISVLGPRLPWLFEPEPERQALPTVGLTSITPSETNSQPLVSQPDAKGVHRDKRTAHWHDFVTRFFRDEDDEAARVERARRKALQDQLFDEAYFYMNRILAVTERMDYLSYRYRKSEQDWMTSGRSLIRFTHAVMQPEAIYFRVDTVHMPNNVSVKSLSDEETLFNLSMSCGRAVLCEYNPEKGFWFIVERTSGVRGIPIHVRLDEIWSMRTRNHDGLAVGFGIGENKRPVWRSYSQMLSMLIAGEPGSGKSNMMNVVLSTLIRFNAPHRLRLALVDLKGGMEFGRYENIPHLMKYKGLPLQKEEPLVPADDPPDDGPASVDNAGTSEDPEMRAALVERADDVLPLLRAVHREGRRRTRLLRRAGHRDLAAYNWHMPKSHYLPHLILVFDELAELKTLKQQDRDNCYTLLISIAQVFRAVGIHLIIATQTPRKDVVKLELKNAVPASLAFNCKNATASALIIGNGRAVGLTPQGRGVLDWGGKQMEIQTPLITTKQVDKIIAMAERGEWDDIELQRHDVTEEELFRVALEEFSGELPADNIWRWFNNRQRRIPRDEVRQIVDKYKGREVFVGSSVYMVKPGKAGHPPFLMAILDSEKDSAINGRPTSE